LPLRQSDRTWRAASTDLGSRRSCRGPRERETTSAAREGAGAACVRSLTEGRGQRPVRLGGEGAPPGSRRHGRRDVTLAPYLLGELARAAARPQAQVGEEPAAEPLVGAQVLERPPGGDDDLHVGERRLLVVGVDA